MNSITEHKNKVDPDQLASGSEGEWIKRASTRENLLRG